MFFEERIAGHANVETADAHIHTEEKKVPMIAVSDAIVQPCCLHTVKVKYRNKLCASKEKLYNEKKAQILPFLQRDAVQAWP